MMIVEFSNKDKNIVDTANYNSCDSLVGLKSFIDDEICVTPVEETETGIYTFQIQIGSIPDEEDYKIPYIRVDRMDYIIPDCRK